MGDDGGSRWRATMPFHVVKRDKGLAPELRKVWEGRQRMSLAFTNEEIDKFCAANGVTDDAQRAAVHDAVRAMEMAEGKLALARMHDSAQEETKRFLSDLPEDTFREDDLEVRKSHTKALMAAAKLYEETLCNQTLKGTLQVMVEMGYTPSECHQIENAARFRMQLRP